MCKWGITTLVRVKVPGDLAGEGKDTWKEKMIDSCIAPIVKGLQEGGIDMRGSCCGHNKGMGEIHLQDGRGLLILSEAQMHLYLVKETNEDPLGGLKALTEMMIEEAPNWLMNR